MSMTSRDIVLANMENTGAPRPGLNFDRGRLDDFVVCGLTPSATIQPRRWVKEEENMEYYEDEWGNLWRRMVGGCVKGEIWEPALKEWSQLDNLRVPDLDDPARASRMKEVFAAHPDKFKAGFPGAWVFDSSRYLRKMDIYFMDLIEHREEVDRLHEIVVSLVERSIRNIADAGADAIFFGEDLGVQDRLLFSPAMWNDIFRPHYERLVGAAHGRGLKVIMHSCGYNWELLDDLIDVGIDCFQFDQPAVYDMPAMAEKFRKHKRCLFSPVDIQKVLPTGDKAFIEAEAARMVETFRGCLIAKVYPDLPGIGVKEEWDQWAYEAVLKAAGIETA